MLGSCGRQGQQETGEMPGVQNIGRTSHSRSQCRSSTQWQATLHWVPRVLPGLALPRPCHRESQHTKRTRSEYNSPCAHSGPRISQLNLSPRKSWRESHSRIQHITTQEQSHRRQQREDKKKCFIGHPRGGITRPWSTLFSGIPCQP